MQLSKPTRSGGAPAQTEGAVPVARTDRTERADRASRPAVVDIQDVEVTLGATTALADVSTTIRAGEAVALLGANGSGKSTMLRAILKLVPHKGSVSLFGSPQHRFRDWHRIGYVPQYADPALQRATVREVVSTGRLAHRRPFTIPGRAERRIVNDLIEQVGLAGREGWNWASSRVGSNSAPASRERWQPAPNCSLSTSRWRVSTWPHRKDSPACCASSSPRGWRCWSSCTRWDPSAG